MSAELKLSASAEGLTLRPSIRSYAALCAPWLILALFAAAIEGHRPSPEVWFPLIPVVVASAFATWLVLNHVVLKPGRILITSGFRTIEVDLADVAKITVGGWRVRKGPFIPFGFICLTSREDPLEPLAKINVKLFRRADIQRLLDELKAVGMEIDV